MSSTILIWIYIGLIVAAAGIVEQPATANLDLTGSAAPTA